jgi:hypothetical protein
MHAYLGHLQFAEALSNDLMQLSRFLQFDARNFKAFSLENSRLLLASCTEIDSLLQQLCSHLKPGKRVKRIDKYLEIAEELFPELIEATGFVGSYGISLTPWIEWKESKDKGPSWWRAHQLVKHNRHQSFEQASLENVLNAAAALEIVLMIYYQRTYMWQHDETLFNYRTSRMIVAQL